jgi:multidrug efflux pump subunit AcrB
LKDFQTRLATSGFELPAGYSLEFGGAAGERNEAVGNLLVYTTVLMTMLVATLILALSSFRLAALVGLVVLFSVGASSGALWSLGYPFGFMAIVGIMGMIGVAVNDSIVVLAALQEKPFSSADRIPAIVDLVVHNTRHVLVTSLTTLVGFVPLMLGGGEFWPPVAICIGVGVAWATLLSLVFVPAGYLCLVPRHS